MATCNHFWSQWSVCKMAGKHWLQRECLWCRLIERKSQQQQEGMNGTAIEVDACTRRWRSEL